MRFGKWNVFTMVLLPRPRDGVPEHEPCFAISARDLNAATLVETYASLIERDAPALAADARQLAKEMRQWREAHERPTAPDLRAQG